MLSLAPRAARLTSSHGRRGGSGWPITASTERADHERRTSFFIIVKLARPPGHRSIFFVANFGMTIEQLHNLQLFSVEGLFCEDAALLWGEFDLRHHPQRHHT